MIRKNLTQVSEQYRNAVNVCRDVFAAAQREFVEPEGVRSLLGEARELFTKQADEAGATRKVEHARDWMIGIATKFLRNGIEFFDGRIRELSYMALDRDIVENMEARLEEYIEAMTKEQGHSFALRLAAYQKLNASVFGALDEQNRRNEHRERLADEEASRKERERRERRRQKEEQNALLARQQQEAAEEAARAKRGQQFDELFGSPAQ